jgi:hypothetical protein
VLTGANGGLVALRAVRQRAQSMSTWLWFAPSIIESRRSDWDKKEKKWWTREL